MTKAQFTASVKKVFDACRELSVVSGNRRPFTPDGRMVGDIGEVAAEIFYQVSLDKTGRKHWDGVCDKRNVQIKATGGKDTYLKQPPNEGFTDGFLMVFRIDRENGDFQLIYNGDIKRAWDSLANKKIDKTGAKQITLDRLLELQTSVGKNDKIPPR